MRLPKRVKWPAVVAAAVVLAGGGTAYAVVGGNDSPTYRTARAVTGDVDQTLSLTGLVDAAQRADLSFGTGGTVSKLKVAEGDQVKAGQVIATLATGDLDAAVNEAAASLAKAKAQLESDETAQTSSVQQASHPGSQGSSSNAGNGPSKPSGSSSGASATTLKKLKEQQQAVLEAQSAASAALAAAHDALAAQTAACATAYQATSTPSADPTSDPSAPADDSSAADTACDAALADVQAKQDNVKDAQDKLADALTELTTTLSAALGSVSGGEQSTPSAARSSARSAAASEQTPGAASNGSSNGSSGGVTVTAARLASDQAQIDQANADLVGARASRAQAVLRSTRAGTLVELDVKRGDTVTTGSTVAVVVGGRSVTLTGTIPEASVEKVKVGQAAKVSVPGSSTTTTGTVTAIGMTADSSSGSTTYPVTVTVDDPTIALPTGSRAQVAIVLATVKDVVTVPISAVTKVGANAVVQVWDAHALTRTRVTLGAVGARTVQVDGINVGTEVVLADVDQAIKGASSELNQRGTFGVPGGSFSFRRGGAGGGAPVTVAR